MNRFSSIGIDEKFLKKMFVGLKNYSYLCLTNFKNESELLIINVKLNFTQDVRN